MLKELNNLSDALHGLGHDECCASVDNLISKISGTMRGSGYSAGGNDFRVRYQTVGAGQASCQGEPPEYILITAESTDSELYKMVAAATRVVTWRGDTKFVKSERDMPDYDDEAPARRRVKLHVSGSGHVGGAKLYIKNNRDKWDPVPKASCLKSSYNLGSSFQNPDWLEDYQSWAPSQKWSSGEAYKSIQKHTVRCSSLSEAAARGDKNCASWLQYKEATDERYLAWKMEIGKVVLSAATDATMPRVSLR